MPLLSMSITMRVQRSTLAVLPVFGSGRSYAWMARRLLPSLAAASSWVSASIIRHRVKEVDAFSILFARFPLMVLY